MFTKLPDIVLVKTRPIILDEHDIHLSATARHKAKIRLGFKVLAFIATPVFIAQTLAFASFIYEEGLQAAAFSARAAIQCNDQTVAYDAVANFETLILKAQAFQARWGCLAFWSHDAYYQYFFAAAPQQLLTLHTQGVYAGLWKDPADRWQETSTPDGGFRTVDTWKNRNVKLLRFHFDPAITDNPQHCLRCRGQLAELAGQPNRVARLTTIP